MLSELEILNVIRNENANTIGTSDTSSELGKQRSKAIDYYHGKMRDLPPLPGWSGVTTRDVFQTIESALPDLLEIFTSNEDIMEFLPEEEEDIQKARQETDVVNHVFYQENKGFLVLYTFIKDSLQAKNGFVKTWWEDRETSDEEHYFNQSDVDLAILQSDDNVEISEIESVVVDPDNLETLVEGGELVEGDPIKSHNVVITRTKDASRVRVQAVPPEEVAVSSEALDLQSATLVRHTPRDKTRSNLLEIGVDPEKVNSLKSVDDDDSEESLARDILFDDDTLNQNANNRSQQNVDVADNYIRLDMRENGKSELWHVMTGDDDTVLLSKTRIARVPISTMTPIIEPHKLFGLSLADLVMDLQRISTFFTRAAIDNAAALNNQRPIISEDGMADSTIDDILMNRPASPIVVKGDVRQAMTYASNNNIAPDMVGLIQYFDSVKTERTGITRFGQDMDPNAIRKDISATEFAGQRSDALKTIKLIARIFAETGLKDMMINIHHALQSHSGNKDRAFRLNGKFVQVNPREWRARTDMEINIGLGTGTKQEQIAQLGGILEQQKIAFVTQGNKDGDLVKLSQIRHTLARIVELQGFKTADAFFEQVDDDRKVPEEKEQPNPELLKIQADSQNNQQKNQIEHQNNVMNAKIKQQDNQQKLELQAFQIVSELQMKAEAQGMEFDFKAAVAEAKLALEQQKIDLSVEEKGINMGVSFAKDLDSISTDLTDSVRVGGNVAG